MVDVVKTVRISDATDKRLKIIAKDLRQTDSDVIRQAIAMLITSYSKDLSNAAKA